MQNYTSDVIVQLTLSIYLTYVTGGRRKRHFWAIDISGRCQVKFSGNSARRSRRRWSESGRRCRHEEKFSVIVCSGLDAELSERSRTGARVVQKTTEKKVRFSISPATVNSSNIGYYQSAFLSTLSFGEASLILQLNVHHVVQNGRIIRFASGSKNHRRKTAPEKTGEKLDGLHNKITSSTNYSGGEKGKHEEKKTITGFRSER